MSNATASRSGGRFRPALIVLAALLGILILFAAGAAVSMYRDIGAAQEHIERTAAGDLNAGSRAGW
ncbi:MAG TPA: hypothetical protein VMY87_11095 [Armatimonadota bacterium]|nr:hypothetical protein [Armatimonadota bacterium]